MTEPVVEKTEEERQADAAAVAEKSRADALAAGNDKPVDAIVPDGPVKPEGVPDKFWDAEKGEVNHTAWAEAHTALETKFHQDGKPAEEKPADDKSEKPAADDSGNEPAQTAAVQTATDEYAEKGELTTATYDALAKNGYSKDMVDSYIAGQEAKATAQTDNAYSVTEGKENFEAMTEWAAEALSETEVKAFNAQVTNADADVSKLAIEGLYKRFVENAPSEGQRIGGNANASTSGTFESKAEMTAAMNEKSETVPGKTKYETDPAFRAEVQKKIAASRKAGKNIFL